MLCFFQIFMVLSAHVTSVSAQCFQGGKFIVGVQAGGKHILLHKFKKDKALSKEEVDKFFDDVLRMLGDENSYKLYNKITDTATVQTLESFDPDSVADTVTVKVFTDDTNITDETDMEALESIFPNSMKNPIQDAIRSVLKRLKPSKQIKNFRVALLTDIPDSIIGDVIVKDIKKDSAKNVAKNLRELKKDDIVRQWMLEDKEDKFRSNNGFVGMHLGYIHPVSKALAFGFLAEGDYVLGENVALIKDDDENIRKKIEPRFNVNLLLRTMVRLNDRAVAGVDMGMSFQEMKMFTQTTLGKTKNSTVWPFNPTARVFMGIMLPGNTMATVYLGGTFPVFRQGEKSDKKGKEGVKVSLSGISTGISFSFLI